MSEHGTDDTSPLSVALAYHRAWTSQDVEQALRHVGDDIVCDAPSSQLRGMAAYRPFLANFAPTVTGYDIIAALGDGEIVVLVYDLHNIQVSSALVCECFSVRDHLIVRNRLIFDQTPYAAARQAAIEPTTSVAGGPLVYVISAVEGFGDEASVRRYAELAGPAFARHGGRFIVANAEPIVIEGETPTRRLSMVEFSSLEAAQTWYESPDNAEARAVTPAAFIGRVLMLVEGTQTPK